MGVVYATEDLKLGRHVLFIVSPALFGGHAVPFAVPF
jgi:hypothetical protein